MTPQNPKTRLSSRLILPLGLVALSCAASAQLNLGTPPEMQGIDITQKLGAQIPLDAAFKDERGRDVKLADYFDTQRPVVLVMNYFKCPQLCGLLLNQLTERMKELDTESAWIPGKQYRILAVSFEPLEGPQQAAAKKRAYLLDLGRSEAADGLHFLTGEKVDINRLEESIGYTKRWSADRQEWIHPSAIVLCTPRGVVSRYLGGLDYDAKTLRLSLVEASEGKTGSLWDKIFLTCYVYESHSGRYVPYAMGIMRAGGAVTVIVVGLMLLSFWRIDVARRRRGRPVPPSVAAVQGAPVQSGK
jgi:protein SCO1/2